MTAVVPPGVPAELVDGLGVTDATPVSGGDIARAFRLATPAGPLFLKWHPDPPAQLFAREAAGLRALRGAGAVATPEVVRESAVGLVLEWIDVGGRTPASEPAFGRQLAGLHRTTRDTFGAVDGALSGYLGSQPIDLRPTTSWHELYAERRVRALAVRAVELGRLDPVALTLVDRLIPRADELCGPPEAPALLHGDLWAGNRLVDRVGRNWLIDPAAHWGHREVDLAMMRLFGGFGEAAFGAYTEAFPLADGWSERIEWYQLAPLLVHAILFGGSYGPAALAAIRRYS